MGSVRTDFLTLNRHFHWMLPVTDGLLLTAVGLVLGPLARWFPRYGTRAAFGLLAFLAGLESIASIQGMHWGATLVLSVGLASCAVRVLEKRAQAFDAVVRKTLPALLVVTAWPAPSAITPSCRPSPAPGGAPRVLLRGTPNVLFVVLDTVPR